jgi:hypothetical protein
MHFQNLGTKILNSAKDTCSEQICQNFKKQKVPRHPKISVVIPNDLYNNNIKGKN